MLYPDDIEKKLGFDALRQRLFEHCLSPQGRDCVAAMRFMVNPESIREAQQSTAEFLQLLRMGEEFPDEHYYDLRPVLNRIRPAGTYLQPEEVFQLKMSLGTIREIIRFFSNKERRQRYPKLSETADRLQFHEIVYAEADRIVDKTVTIRDNASTELQRIRRTIQQKQDQVSKVVHQIFKSIQSSGWTEKESLPVIRDGRLMIPVLAPFKRQIKGIVHDESTTGKTVFIEPVEAVELNNTIKEYQAEEKREIRRILIAFADEVRPYIADLIETYQEMGFFDFTRAKAKLANDMEANAVEVANLPVIRLIEAKNPLLWFSLKREGKTVVPLTLSLTENQRIMLISGPNAGGKSVAMKTVGLLQYMLQCGMLLPAQPDSSLGVFRNIFVDIGDDQSIENDLSTYSSHLQHMKTMLRYGDEKSLILIDEFGSGTEPVIGGAIAEAVLHQLNNQRVFGVVTTHYSNLKHYASQTPGVVNAAMMFDMRRIEPTFRLEQGKPGGSFAIEIAHKIGLPVEIINDAKQRAGEQHANFDKHLREIQRDKKYWEEKRDKIRLEQKQLEELLQKQITYLEEAKQLKKEITEKARQEFEQRLKEANRQIENLIRELREAQASKDKIKEVKEKLQDLKNTFSNLPESDEDSISRRLSGAKKVASKHQLSVESAQPEQEQKPLEKSDYVRLEGQTTIGQIVEISEKTAVVAFGQFITTVDPKKLSPVPAQEARKALRQAKSMEYTRELSKKRLSFKPHIDVRGHYPDEALMIVSELIDNALMFGVKEVKILHGRGNGVLRSVIRDYLKTQPSVIEFSDEHVELGGDGITVVRLE
ncbi:MAG TPA: Smr/MutS family protein [Salinivirgaceae bacterium]|nr:Smr/MutS family protein [Salinivirgaceae bacterium]